MRTDDFFNSIEDHGTVEGIRLRKPTPGKLRFIGMIIGVVAVNLLAAWMASHS